MIQAFRIKKVMFALAALITVMGISACNKKESNENKEPKGVTVTAPPTKKDAAPTTEGKPTEKPVDITKEVTPTTEAMSTPGAEEERVLVSREDAEKIIKGIVNNNAYEIKLRDENLNADGSHYYLFAVSQDGKTEDALIAVDREDASVYYYNNGFISEFTRFPLDNVEIVNQNEENIQEQEAVRLISELSKEQLGLDKPFAEYETDTDHWTSIVKGKECYCVNVFDLAGTRRQLAGVFYVSVDGSVIYRLDEDNNFINISK